MKIVHIANFYGSTSGGIKTTIHELGRGYQRYGHEFIYVVPGPKFMQEQTPFGTMISLPSHTLPFTGGYQVIKSNKQLLTLLEFLKPDRIEVSDRFTLIKVGKWAKRMKIPTVVFSHETLAGLAKRFLPFIPNFIRELFVNRQNRKLANSFDKVIVTTKFAGDEFTKLNISNLSRISLGVDLNGFNPSLKSYRLRKELIKNSDYLMIYSGRLSPEKDPMRVLDALRNLLDRGIKVRLVVLGGGAMWNKFRAVAKELPVEMVGYVVSREKVANYLSCADVAIAPGPLETFCLSALESLASGVPVVASASSAVGEILNSDGIEKAGLVADNKGESFADAIEQILKDKSFQRNARKRAENFAWATTIDQMLELHNAKPPMVTVRRRLRVA
jgi:alpha-1,6-mannosyltransferase